MLNYGVAEFKDEFGARQGAAEVYTFQSNKAAIETQTKAISEKEIVVEDVAPVGVGSGSIGSGMGSAKGMTTGGVDGVVGAEVGERGDSPSSTGVA